MKFALRETMTPGTDLARQLGWLADLGFDGVELCGPALALPARELAAVFADSPVRAANVGGSPNLIDPDPRTRQAALDTMRERIDLAAALGAVGVLTVPQFGRALTLPDLAPYRSALELERDLLVAQLRQLGPVAAAAGVTVFLEPLNRYEQHLVNRLDQGASIAAECGPGVAIMADLFHMNIEEPDLAASIRDSAAHIVHVHVADSNRHLPGNGHLDFRAPFAALKQAGYDGYLGFECRLDEPADRTLAASAEHLRKLWDQA